MDKFDRIYLLDGLFKSHQYPISIHSIMDELQCSRATTHRLLNLLRDQLFAPLESNQHGYYYLAEQSGQYELPGLWFTHEELYALLAAYQMLVELEPGLFDQQLAPLKNRIENILRKHGYTSEEVLNRIRILGIGYRKHENKCFRYAATAVLERFQLTIEYISRSKNTLSRRVISPQRLTHYRDNWYLDAWCHDKQAFRTFAIERITKIKQLNEPAKEFSEDELNQHYASAYGIFAGTANKSASLKFNPQRARWVAEENWHPQQQGQWHNDGSYVLTLPYHNPTELIMDIMKYGSDVEVLEPVELRQAVMDEIEAMSNKYK